MSFEGFDAAMLNDLLFGWVDGTYYRPMKEVQRYRIFNIDDNTSVLVANTLGVAKEDLSVKMSGDMLTIQGETEQKDIGDKASVNYCFRLSKEKKVKKINWRNADGFTYVYFHYEEPEDVEIEYKED